ncbi:MAG TPA: RNB domain-containing ribonuclease [Solirubrobacterales bacterium]|jgi:ribonuclease R|nr:RNB domain-containing ribonuclease [Solirubrobacterales bacterium]
MSQKDWRYYRARQRARGRGRRTEPRTAREAVDALLREELGGRGFPPSIAVEAGRAAGAAEAREPRRRDLLELPTFTVDPATARDFDDAVSARREDGATRLWIHIADVAAHVPPGSRLDLEARRRGNSTYAPGTVEPMLPYALSEEACSLAPGVERLAVTAEIELGSDGGPRSASFYRSRIRSDARLDYDQLDAVFSGLAEAPQAVAEPLGVAREAAAALGERPGTTSLEVESFEPEFRFDADGHPIAARAVAQTESHRLIERLMILANEQVARLLERKRVPTIFRVHPQPDPPRIERLIEQLAELEIPTPPLRGGLAPRQAAEVAAEASRLVAAEARRRGHGRDAYTSLVLRSLKQAQYSERNSSHAGLGSAAYCHFTSPIRRYPDLIVHRALLATLGEGEAAPSAAEAREVAWHCSERERESMRIERRGDDICAAFLLAREQGERGLEVTFEGEVSGLVRSGAFVAFGGELGDVYEGFLPARLLGGAERFELNATETALIGGESRRRLRFGDPVAVRVTGIEAPRGRVDLEPVEG